MSWQVSTIVLATVAAGINAGAFFAFSNFVMPALADLVPGDGASAMQSINRHAPNPSFVLTIVGAGVIAAPALAAEPGQDGAGWLAAGIVLSLVSFGITVACNVPRNDALEAARSEDIPPFWAGYVVTWTRWNTVRTITSAASVAAYVVAVRGR